MQIRTDLNPTWLTNNPTGSHWNCFSNRLWWQNKLSHLIKTTSRTIRSYTATVMRQISLKWNCLHSYLNICHHVLVNVFKCVLIPLLLLEISFCIRNPIKTCLANNEMNFVSTMQQRDLPTHIYILNSYSQLKLIKVNICMHIQEYADKRCNWKR